MRIEQRTALLSYLEPILDTETGPIGLQTVLDLEAASLNQKMREAILRQDWHAVTALSANVIQLEHFIDDVMAYWIKVARAENAPKVA